MIVKGITLRSIFKDPAAATYLKRDGKLHDWLQRVFWEPRGHSVTTSDKSLTVEEMLTIIRDWQSEDKDAEDLKDIDDIRRRLYVLIYHAIYVNKSSDKAHLNGLMDACATKTKSNVYGIRKIKTHEGRTTSQLLHRFIMEVTDRRIDVDHKDHNGLNCQRYNLRRCVRGENTGYQRKSRGSSRYKGVSWDSARQMWRAHIRVHNTSRFLGRFRDEHDAALAYDAAARTSFGVFALCNFDLQE